MLVYQTCNPIKPKFLKLNLNDFKVILEFFSDMDELKWRNFIFMEIKYFRLIKTITEEGNIVNSSEKLFLTQSALSHQLIVLEERLGFKVFNRSRNNWKLTEEGEELYKLANEVLGSIESRLNSIKEIKNGNRGKVRLGTECYFLFQGIPSFVQKMGILYPEIEIELSGAAGDSFESLLSNEIDAAFVTMPSNTSKIVTIELLEDEIMAVMHEEHHLANRKYLMPEDFLDITLILLSFPLSTVSVYKKFLAPASVEPKKMQAGVHAELCIEMIETNMGVMCIPKWVLKPFKTSDKLRFVKIGKHGLKRKHYLAIRKKDMGKKYMDDFVSSFEEDFSTK